jgi:arabinose-5-phosphate isomerase
MTAGCVTVGEDILAAEALRLMEARSINGLLVVDSLRRPIGALNMHDLLRAGVV